MAETIVAPHGLSIWKTLAAVRVGQRIRRFLRRWQPRSVSQAVSLWRTKEARAGMVAAQWDRPLMRRGRACKTLRDLGGRRSKADRLGRKYNLALSRPTSRLHGRLACRSYQRYCARLMDCGQMGALAENHPSQSPC